VQLFEILQDGFHTPLTEAQIAELFHAGRLNRQTRCKPANQGQWRTIDELFPLLKYHAPWQFASESAESRDELRFRRAIIAGAGFVVAAAATLVLYFYSQSQSSAGRPVTAIDSISTSAVPSPVRRGPSLSPQPTQNRIRATTTAPSSGGTAGPAVIQPVEQVQPQAAIRLAEGQRIAEQARRDQAQAQQDRAAREHRLLEQQKAGGHDHHVPFDNWQTIDVGGESVTLKIHDNDTTSFDVWMNYGVRREVKKEKGITHSGTDETLIYSNGRAALYYVWEISGRINHCLLRVRDA
jgi:cytoskeletal protein RodZ